MTQRLAPGDYAAKVSDTLPGKFYWTFVLGLRDSSIASIREMQNGRKALMGQDTNSCLSNSEIMKHQHQNCSIQQPLVMCHY